MDRIIVSVGDPASVLHKHLGPPDAAKALKNDAPATMGASVIEYAFAHPVAILRSGDATIPVGAVQFVLDGGDRILRILENPNAFSRGPRLQRGTPLLAESAELPTDPALRVPR